jgi:Leucine-rich repeat (LRR) protein
MDGSSSPRLEAIQEQLSVPPLPGETAESVQVRALANHLAVISEDVSQRKKSVTTQDFLDDAMKVMHFIRTQYRPNSNMASVNEQDSGMLNALDESVFEFPEPPSDLSLERPPSREGRPSGWRTGKVEHNDPRVVSHLHKYREHEDEAFLTASSRDSRAPRSEVTAAYIETVTSDPPGLHIIGQSAAVQERSRSRSHSNSSDKALNSTGTNGTKGSKATHSSSTSIDSTMGRTTNSRKSENVATLAPDAVAHLIPEQVAGMTYDKELGRWVKAKGTRKERTIANEHSGMTGSDNDPFGDIPDLTVDSMEETKHLLLSKSASRRPISHPPEGASALLTDFGSRPASRDHEDPHRPDSMQSLEDSRLHLSPPKPRGPREQTIATPTSDRPQLVSTPVEISEQNKPQAPEMSPETEDEDIEHEISIFEGRAQAPSPREMRNITVSLSSPGWARTRPGLSPVLENPGVSTKDYGYMQPQATPAFQRQDNRQLNLSVRFSGTVTTKNERQDVAHVKETPCKGDITFYLSELPDFTLNQIDEREVQGRVLSKRNTVGPVFRGDEDRYASGNHLLVKALQDVEPDEPYWEDLRKVDLHSKGLTSLHLLDVLCDRLEKLDASGNALSQLNGAPHTIRVLSVYNNMLTSLTAWGHLFNLQYLDISHNQIESLEGLAGLVHLRELRADGNNINSLDGIEDLDGLLTLSLRANELTEVNFEGYEL